MLSPNIFSYASAFVHIVSPPKDEPAPGDDLGDGAGGTEEEQDEDEESTSDESVFE